MSIDVKNIEKKIKKDSSTISSNGDIKKIKIKEIGSTLTGFAFNSQKFNEEKGFPIIRIRDLKQGMTETFFDGEFDEKYLVRKGDLLIGMDGEFNLVEWESDDALLNQRVCKLIIDESKTNKTYIKYALPKKLKEIEDVTPFVTVKHISNKQVLEIEIPLPDLKTQKEIAYVLEQADKARQQRKAANALTDQFLQSSFLSLFGDPVKNGKGWNKIRLDEVCDFENGDRSSNYPSGDEVIGKGIIFINSANIIDFRFDPTVSNFITEEKYNSLRSGKCKRGDIIFTLRGNGLGKCCIFDSIYDEGFVNAQLVILKCSETINNNFLIHQLQHPGMFETIWKLGSGSAQPQLSATQLATLEIILPPLSLQQQFAGIVAQAEQLRQKQRESERELENLFQGLLQRYFG